MSTLISAADLARAPSLREMFADQARQRNRTKPRVDFTPKVQYQHPDLGDDPQDDPVAEYNLRVVKIVGVALAREYPVHGKLARLEATGGVVMIELPPIIVRPACGIVNLAKTPIHQWEKVAVRVFGELLERLRLSRQRFDQGDFIRAIEGRTLRQHRHGIVPE